MLKQKIQHIIERVNISFSSGKDIFGILQDICQDFYLHDISLSIFFGEERISDSFFLYSTYKPKWIQHYKDQQYYLCDPLFSCLQKISIPFEWDIQDFKDLFPLQQKLMEEAYSFGIKSGTTIPLLPQTTFHGFLTVLNQTALHPDILYVLSLVGNICTQKIIELKKSEELKILTARERDILFQKSQGLTIKNIGKKLKISPSTTAFHLANIRKKLRAQTTENAVLKFTILKKVNFKTSHLIQKLIAKD